MFRQFGDGFPVDGRRSIVAARKFDLDPCGAPQLDTSRNMRAGAFGEVAQGQAAVDR